MSSQAITEEPSAPVAVKQRSILIPDLIAHCTFELHTHPRRDQSSRESEEWYFKYVNYAEKQKQEFILLKGGDLAAVCYPFGSYEALRVTADWTNYLFYLDDVSDEMDNNGTTDFASEIMNTLYHPTYEPKSNAAIMARDFWERVTATGSPGAQQRFLSTFGQFFQAVTIQAAARKAGDVPDLESYLSLRRDTSGCKPCFALIEYANDLDLPYEVIDDPIIHDLGESANDLIGWSNDMYSYNREQGKGDVHNMIAVVMNQQGLDLDSAIEFVGDMCRKSMDRFLENKKLVPSWGPEIDRQVQLYIGGLEDWIVGTLLWSFETTRYFENPHEVKETRTVYLKSA